MDDTDFHRRLRNLGQNIRSLRSTNGLSQEGFANVCGLDRTYIGGVERGERNLSLKNLLKIADTLGVPPADLLKDTQSEMRGA